MKRDTALLAAAVFGLNAFLCWPLFQMEYLNDFQSNEGSFISIGRFILEHWPQIAWLPWFNGGTPLPDAYFPLVPALVAGVAAVARCSPEHAFHFLAALAYSVGPVFLFLFVHKVSARTTPALAAALGWSLFSPALFLPNFRADDRTLWALHRLRTIVFYGETPHNLALSLFPLAWLLLLRYWEAPRPRRFALVSLVSAAIMLSNGFGFAGIAISIFLLWLTMDGRTWSRLLAAVAVLLVAYLLVCGLLSPSLLRDIAVNSQTIGGDFRHSLRILALLPLLAALWWTLRLRFGPLVRFAALFTALFGSIVVLYVMAGIDLAPSPQRYILEAELGFWILAAFGLHALWQRLPSKVALVIAIPALLFVARADYRFARDLIQPADLAAAPAYREASWIRAHLPNQRVFASGDTQFWLNLFADNPQMAAGHEAAASWVDRAAVYTIYTGQNAGAQDGPISVLWLKAFGCAAITVPGPRSRDYFHPVLNPDKFVGLLPLVWREGDDSIYRVPLRSASLAYVVPRDALVTSRPIHGLDVGQLRLYVAALEDPSLTEAKLEWKNPDHGRIDAMLKAGQVISVQMTYDPGWHANVNGRPVPVRSDGLGFIVIDPATAGPIVADLSFTGGLENRVSLYSSFLAALVLLGIIVLPYGRG